MKLPFDAFPSWLTHMTGKLVLAIDSLAQLLSTWTSHWVSSPCGNWFLPEWAIQETKAKVARHCHYDLASEVTYHHSCYILLVTQENPWFRMGEDYTKAWILGGANHWGRLGDWLPQSSSTKWPSLAHLHLTTCLSFKIKQYTIAFTSVYLHHSPARESSGSGVSSKNPSSVSQAQIDLS